MRRSLGVSGVVLLVLAVGLAPHLGSAQTPATWYTFHGDSTHSGLSSGPGPTTATLANQWTLPKTTESSLAVGPDGTGYIGDDAGNVYALSPSNGTSPKWVFATPNKGKILSAPTVSKDGTRVYVGSYDGHVYAIDTTTGKSVWDRDLGGAVQASPTLSNDGATLYVPIVNGTVSAISTSNGQTAWSKNLNGAAIVGSVTLSPDGSTLYVATSNQVLSALPSNGSSNGTGVNLPGTPFGSPAADQAGNVYVTTSNGSLVSIPGGGSTPRWTFETGSHQASFTTPAIGPNGTIFYGTNDGFEYAISPSGGELWGHHTGAAVESSAAVAGGNSLVFFGSDDGVIYADDFNGNHVWQRTLETKIQPSPALTADGYLWVASQAGVVYRFHELSPPPTPNGTPPPLPTSTPGATPTPGTLPTVGPSGTPVAGALTATLKAQVAAGKKQLIAITGAAGTVVHIRIEYPNGDHQSKSLKLGTNGKGTYSYTQGSSKIKHNRFYATVLLRTGPGAGQTVATYKYKILFGKIDLSIEPRRDKAGHVIQLWVHTNTFTGVRVQMISPNRHTAQVTGRTGPHGWAHMSYKISAKLRHGKNTKVTSYASLVKGRPGYITSSFYIIP